MEQELLYKEEVYQIMAQQLKFIENLDMAIWNLFMKSVYA